MPRNLPLKVAIYASKMSQYEIGEMCGFSEKTMSYIVTGRRPTSTEEERKIAKALGLERSHIFPE